jgi:hypothetical protein
MAADTEVDPIERGLRRLSVAECNSFWQAYEALRPNLKLARGNHWSRWRAVAGADLFIAVYLTNRSVGLFVRGERGLSLKGALRRLDLYEPRLSRALGVATVSHGCPYLDRLPLATNDRDSWPEGHRWLIGREQFYHDTLARIVGGIDDEAG